MQSSKAIGYLLFVVMIGEGGFVNGLANNSIHKSASVTPATTTTTKTTTTKTTTESSSSRRSFFVGISTLAAAATVMSSHPQPANAAADCFKDCMKECKLIAPKDPDYCTANCKGYCEQEDRKDGLSGSVSAESGEVGLLGGTWGQGTVTKSDDKVSYVV